MPELRAGRRREVHLLTVWALICAAIGSLHVMEGGLYLSQILLIAAGLSVLILRWRAEFLLAAALAGGILILLTVASIVAGGTANPRFIPEHVKLMLLVFGGLSLSAGIVPETVRQISWYLPRLIAAMSVVTWLGGWGDYYGDVGRFGIPLFGSPNSTAFVLAMCLAFSLHAQMSWGKFRLHKKAHVFQSLCSLVLTVFLMATQSLGGILTGAVIVLRYFGVRLRTQMIGGAAAILGTFAILNFFPSIEVPELLGSGRLLIWGYLLNELQAADWPNQLLGMGPGAIELTPWFTLSVLSAHSMYLEMLYSYGVFGLTLLIASLWYAGRIVSMRVLDYPHGILLQSLLGGLVAGFFVDTYLLTAQLGWFGALVIAIIVQPLVRSVPWQRRVDVSD